MDPPSLRVSTAMQLANELKSTVQRYSKQCDNGRDETLAKLQFSLNHLNAILGKLEEAATDTSTTSLQKAPDGTRPIWELLENLVRHCVEIYPKFKVAIEEFDKSETGQQLNWAKMEFMGFDIYEFGCFLLDCASTITAGLETILHTCISSRNAVGWYDELVTQTLCCLEIRLQRTREKMNTTADATPLLVDLQAQETVLLQCHGICQHAMTYTTSSLALQKESFEEEADGLNQFSAFDPLNFGGSELNKPLGDSDCKTETFYPEIGFLKQGLQAYKQRASILSDLHNQPASRHLRAYFKKLEEGSPNWDIDTFVEGLMCLADLCGPQRTKYYAEELKGLHYPSSFTELWNRRYPHHCIKMWDEEIKLQCPPSWSNTVREGRWVLRYEGKGPLSKGLNEALEGPTTMDCGMYIQFAVSMTLRYVIGDAVFDKWFKSQQGHFELTQYWDRLPDDTGTKGNLLYPFYDSLSVETTGSPKPQARIQILCVYNDILYLSKHPGGMARLQNVIKIDGRIYTFVASASRNILSETELKESLLQEYNAPQDFADNEKLFCYNSNRNTVHPRFRPNSYGDLAKIAEELKNHTFDEAEWNARRVERDRTRMHRIFNFHRLMDSVEKCKDT